MAGDLAADSEADATPIKTVNGLMLMWPLYAVSTAPLISDHLRQWIRMKLREIGHRVRIPKALALVSIQTAIGTTR